MITEPIGAGHGGRHSHGVAASSTAPAPAYGSSKYRSGLASTSGLYEGEADATMQAFSQWLSEMKARSNSSLKQMTEEMGLVREGITSNNTDLIEYKRHSISVQQQMQSQLTDLREKLTSAYGEIASLVKQKNSTDQELNGEIVALQQQLTSKTSELESLKKTYSNTHQQLQNSIIQIQGQLQATSSEIQAARRQAAVVQEGVQQKMGEVESTLQRIRSTLDASGREGQSHALVIQEDIAKLYEAITALSTDFYDHKRLTLQMQSKLTGQVAALEEGRRRTLQHAEESRLAGTSADWGR